MNNKHKNLEKEIQETVNDMMLAYKEMKRTTNIFTDISTRYAQLGISENEIFDTVAKVAAEVNPELYKELHGMGDPTFEQALLIEY